MEEEKLESAASEDENRYNEKRMKSMMKDLKNRTDDISEFEKMTEMKFEMEGVKVNMNKMSDALTKILDESQRRHQKIEELFIMINEDIRTRDKRTEARVEVIENTLMRRLTKSSRKRTSQGQTKRHAVMKTPKEDSTNRTNRMQSGSTTASKMTDKEEDVKAEFENSIKVTGMKDVEYTIDCLAKTVTHVFVEFQSTKIRDRYVRSAGMQKAELNG